MTVVSHGVSHNIAVTQRPSFSLLIHVAQQISSRVLEIDVLRQQQNPSYAQQDLYILSVGFTQLKLIH